MANLEQAIAHASLLVPRGKSTSVRVRSAEEVRESLWAEAEARGKPFTMDPDKWRDRWLASQNFRLMSIPVNAVAMPCDPRDQTYGHYRMNAATDRPIVVDINKPGVGRTKDGYVPPITVIDGKHRFFGASLRGESHIMAWVGDLAAARILGVLGERHKPVTTRRNRPVQTKMDQAMLLYYHGKNLR